MTTRARFRAVRFAYVVLILLATLNNLELSPDTAAATERLLRAVRPTVGWADAIDALRNLVLFAGLGTVWVMTSMSSRAKTVLAHVTLIGLAVSVTVEAAQAFSPVRMASLLDVSTDTVGALIGGWITLMAARATWLARDEKSYIGIPTILMAVPYEGALVCETLAPLFHSEVLAWIPGGPLARWRHAVALALPLDWREIPVLDVPLFLAAGVLAVAWQRSRGRSGMRAWLGPGLLGAIAIVMGHAIHGSFGLVIRWEAAATDALSFVAGACISALGLPAFTQRFRGVRRARAVVATYSALLIVWAWRPLLPETRLAAIVGQFRVTALIPLASLAVRADVFSALHVGQQFFLYIPLGAMLAVWPMRASGWLATMWPAVLFAIVLELGHIVVAGRLFDMTNAFIAIAGLAMGWLVVRRSQYPIRGALSKGSGA